MRTFAKATVQERLSSFQQHLFGFINYMRQHTFERVVGRKAQVRRPKDQRVFNII